MRLIEIKADNSPIWSEVWSLYVSSFPQYERREELCHKEALKNRRFITKIAIDDVGNFLALLFYWHNDDFIYIEHLAVNPKMRGANIGTQIVKLLQEQSQGAKIILEIDPPTDDISYRRLQFYKRLDFVENPYEYTHPSYSKEPFIHRLDLMSYPEGLSQLEYDDFCRFMFDVVLLTDTI